MTDMTQGEIDWGDVPKDIVLGFEDFHALNPHVELKLTSMARTLARKGHKRIGMQMLFEVLRWRNMMKTVGEPLKLNNSYVAFYSRVIEANNPDLENIFTKRRSKADDK